MKKLENFQEDTAASIDDDTRLEGLGAFMIEGVCKYCGKKFKKDLLKLDAEHDMNTRFCCNSEECYKKLQDEISDRN